MGLSCVCFVTRRSVQSHFRSDFRMSLIEALALCAAEAAVVLKECPLKTLTSMSDASSMHFIPYTLREC